MELNGPVYQDGQQIAAVRVHISFKIMCLFHHLKIIFKCVKGKEMPMIITIYKTYVMLMRCACIYMYKP